jgi:1-deoxy-D-xylulose-5-phosphate reductoisomerase
MQSPPENRTVMTKKRIAVLGSTGSIGVQALDLISQFEDRFEVVALAARSRVDRLVEQASRWRPRLVCLAENDRYPELKSRCGPLGVEAVAGDEGLRRVAEHPEVDLVLAAIVGAAGLNPTLSAIRRGKTVALANKEALVMAGDLMLREAEKHGGFLLPVDSEHSALHQCLRGEKQHEVNRLILTASGGPFRETTPSQL